MPPPVLGTQGVRAYCLKIFIQSIVLVLTDHIAPLRKESGVLSGSVDDSFRCSAQGNSPSPEAVLNPPSVSQKLVGVANCLPAAVRESWRRELSYSA